MFSHWGSDKLPLRFQLILQTVELPKDHQGALNIKWLRDKKEIAVTTAKCPWKGKHNWDLPSLQKHNTLIHNCTIFKTKAGFEKKPTTLQLFMDKGAFPVPVGEVEVDLSQYARLAESGRTEVVTKPVEKGPPNSKITFVMAVDPDTGDNSDKDSRVERSVTRPGEERSVTRVGGFDSSDKLDPSSRKRDDEQVLCVPLFGVPDSLLSETA